MHRKLWMVILIALSLPLPAAGAGEQLLSTARQVIDANLEAVGGVGKLEGIETLMLRGASGSALLPPSEKSTVWLQKPDKFKQVGAFRIILYDGERCVLNDGEEVRDLTGGTLENMKYRTGFYHNGFSLLKWERYFSSAQLLGIKRYGSVKQYELLFPGAENGHDLRAYIDTDTLLLDRLVYTISQEGAKTLDVVNQLRDWKEIDGISMPTRIVFDKIGWETTPTHFVIEEIVVNPGIEDGLFDSTDIDFGVVTIEDGAVRGEIFGDMDGSLLTNIREEDLAEAGIEPKSYLNLAIGDTNLKIRYLSNIQRSAADIKPGEIYITTYPISLYPRTMLLGWNIDVTEKIPCKRGDLIVLTSAGDE